METAIKALLTALGLILLGVPAEAGNPYAEAAERDAALEATIRTVDDAEAQRGGSADEAVQREERYEDGARAEDDARYERYQGGRSCGQGYRRNYYGNCVFDQDRRATGGNRVWVVTNGVGRWVTYPTVAPPRNITSPSRIQAPPSKIAAPPSKIAAPPSDIRPPW